MVWYLTPYNTKPYKQYSTTQYNAYSTFTIQYIYLCDTFIQSGNLHERVTEGCVYI